MYQQLPEGNMMNEKNSISGMNDLFIDFSDKYSTLESNISKEKNKFYNFTHVMDALSNNKQANKVDDDERIR